nr:GTP pyrophosphokinase family protein [Frisingicoccus sp.]
MERTENDNSMPFLFEDIKSSEHPEVILANVPQFKELMMQYECAIMEVNTKLHVLNNEFSHMYQRNPIENIETRIKTPASILEKLSRRNLPICVESLENGLTDIAGIRVICPFPDDIYNVADLLTSQDDVTVIARKDYIKNPKPNGYRSLHLIIEIPIFLASRKKNMKVEVQFRTIAMDFWASLDHKLRYKQDLKNSEEIASELKECADIIAGVDLKMQNIRKKIQ